MCCAIFLLLLLAPATSLNLVCGYYHNCVFERGQEAMKCWGGNVYAQLGYGDTNRRGDDANEMGSNLPLLNIGTGFTVEAMSLGWRHSCAMSDDRAMKCFGSNADSQLGFGSNTYSRTTGDALPFLEFGVDFNLSKIAAGFWHTCVLSTDAALKCFGKNWYGQCGAGTTTDPISGPPSQITAIDFGTNFTAVDVSAFYYHVCALSQQQTAKCFGHNDYAQLGYGDTTQRGKTPASMGDGLPIVDLGSDFSVAAIATGGFHSCALSKTKTVKCWGDNRFGACGTPYSSETGDNLPVLEFGADFVPMQLALGGRHTCILSETAALICFGDNGYGQLGIGSTTDVFTPSTLTGIDLGSDFVPRQVAAGFYHTCAVSTGDDIKCFGDNDYYGQLGLGHTDNMGDGPNEMGDNLPFVYVCLGVCSEAPTTSAPTTSKQPTVSPSTTASPSSEPTHVPTTQPTTKQPSTFSPTTASPSATMASTHEPITSSPTPPPVTVSTEAQTTTTLVTPTVAETTAAPASPSSAVTSSTPPTQTIVIIAACASALFVAAVCICAAAFYYVRKNYVRMRKDRRLSENVAEAHVEEEAPQARNEADNDAEVRVPPPGVVAYARENAHVEDTRGEDNLSLPAQESVLSVDARRRDNIELAIAEVRVVHPGVFAYAQENAHVEDTRGEDNLSLPAQESVLCVDDGIAQNEGRRQSRVSQLQNHGVDATATQTTVTTSGATSGIDPSLGVYELNLMVDL